MRRPDVPQGSGEDVVSSGTTWACCCSPHCRPVFQAGELMGAGALDEVPGGPLVSQG